MLMVCWEFFSDTIWTLHLKHIKQILYGQFLLSLFYHNLGEEIYEKLIFFHLLFLHGIWTENIYAIKNISERKSFDFLKIRIHLAHNSSVVLITLVLFSILKRLQLKCTCERLTLYNPFFFDFPFSFSFLFCSCHWICCPEFSFSLLTMLQNT